MPSSHANCLFFFATSIAIRLTRRDAVLGMTTGAAWTDAVLLAVSFAYAWTISLTRVYVECDHTIEQVVAGVVLGSACAWLNEFTFRPWSL